MKNKHNSVSIRSEEEELKQIKSDIVQVVLLNGLIFIVLVGLYFYNRSTGAVDSFFANLLNF